MSSSELESVKIVEDVIKRNVDAVVAFSNETRQIVRGLEEKVGRLEDQLRNKENEVQQLRTMVSAMQAKVYAGGSV